MPTDCAEHGSLFTRRRIGDLAPNTPELASMLISATDPVGAALHSALDGLAYRQRVTADNIANVDTPGFTATKVDFEDSLRGALEDGTYSEGETVPTTSSSTAQRGANGNN